MIDLQKAEDTFDEYVSNYGDKEEKIVLKKEHTKRVMKEARNIAEYLNLDEEDCKLAELIGLLHDIGRFEQVKRYNTFSDRYSIDHAELGLEVLFKDGYIRKFIEDEQYDSIIYKTIHNHNKYQIEQNLTDRELLHSKIIRDADKIDILKIEATKPLDCLYDINNLENGIISENIYKSFLKCQTVSRKEMETELDGWVIAIAFVFDLNFPISLKKIEESKYLHEMITRIEYKREDTKSKMEQIEKTVNQYIKEKTKNN